MAKSTTAAKVTAPEDTVQDTELHVADMVFDRSVFDIVVAGTMSAAGMAVVNAEAVAKIVDYKLAEVDSTSLSADGMINARLTDAGKEAYTFLTENPEEGPQAGESAAAIEKKKRNRSPIKTPTTFTMSTVAVPIPASRRGSSGGELYPFKDLEVGGSFHLTVKEEELDVLLSRLNSSVSTANARYVETKHPKGDTLGAKFITRGVGQDDPDGYGIRVWRTA